jgi:glycosyltransferase involved in cell wall biosynthesis
MRASIIVRAFNAENTIARALDSVLAEEFPQNDLEIIVVDDGSTDATPDILSRYEHVSNVRSIRQDNQGAIHAANIGFRAATGDVVALLDGDDAYEPRFLAETVPLFEADPGLDYVYTDYYEVYGGAKRLVEVADLFHTIVVNGLYRRNSLMSAGLWTDVFFAEYDLLLRTYETWKRAHVEKPLVTYYRRSESLTAQPARVAEGIAELSERHPDKLKLIGRIRPYALAT